LGVKETSDGTEKIMILEKLETKSSREKGKPRKEKGVPKRKTQRKKGKAKRNSKQVAGSRFQVEWSKKPN